MPLNEADRSEIARMIADGQRVTPCSAENFHQGRLHYSGGRSGMYVCECGMRYEKDGHGGLRDSPPLRPLRPVV